MQKLPVNKTTIMLLHRKVATFICLPNS